LKVGKAWFQGEYPSKIQNFLWAAANILFDMGRYGFAVKNKGGQL
jgi:hypothetical protein